MTINFDDTAGVYEVFADDGEWLGCFDTIREAKAFAAEKEADDAFEATAKKILASFPALPGGRYDPA